MLTREKKVKHRHVRRAVSDVCVDYTVDGWFKDKSPQTGLPSSQFVARPPGINECELAQLHRDCVDRINMYRSGALKFSDGTKDSNVQAGLELLVETTGNNQCSSEAAMGDLVVNVEGSGGCDGAHENAFVCGFSVGGAQNSCCGRGGGSFGAKKTLDTYAEVQTELL